MFTISAHSIKSACILIFQKRSNGSKYAKKCESEMHLKVLIFFRPFQGDLLGEIWRSRPLKIDISTVSKTLMLYCDFWASVSISYHWLNLNEMYFSMYFFFVFVTPSLTFSLDSVMYESCPSITFLKIDILTKSWSFFLEFHK